MYEGKSEILRIGGEVGVHYQTITFETSYQITSNKIQLTINRLLMYD